MKSFNTKLALSALGVALLATPAFAAEASITIGSRRLRHRAADGSRSHYPNGAHARQRRVRL